MGIIMSGFKDLVRLLPKTANRKPSLKPEAIMPDEPNEQPKEQSAPAPEPAPKPEPTPQPEPAPQPTPPVNAALLVERWWQDWFPSSPVSRDTAAWNHAYQAKEDLKKRLTK
jgi:outer membrane biosynthesis protein TonB